MKRLTPASLGAVLFFLTIAALIQGCASLEPLPRFRSSSVSFAPDQLPLSQRSTSDLMDPTTVGAYSTLKEHAMHPMEESAGEIRQLIINQATGISMHVDEVGLDSEQMDDELAANEEFGNEEPPVDESVLQRVIQKTYTGAIGPQAEDENPAVNRIELMKEIVNLLGVSYHYGGMDAVRGLDCSAFVGTVYSRALGVRLPRSSNEQFSNGVKVRKSDLRIGDLVFFKTRRKRAPVSHVGIYVGSNLFAHASTRHGVIISTLEEGYYNKTFVGARRLLSAEMSDAGKMR